MKLKIEAQGIVTLRKLKNEVEVFKSTFNNMILNKGLEYSGLNSDYLDYCSVGTGSAPVNENDSELSKFLFKTNSRASADTSGAQPAPPYFVNLVRVFRFNKGQATGNVSEIGFGWAHGLYSRVLVKDSNGNPTTITVQADEILDVTYEHRVYIKTDEISGIIVPTGGKSDIQRAWSALPAGVTRNQPVSGWSAATSMLKSNSGNGCYVSLNGLSAITSSPVRTGSDLKVQVTQTAFNKGEFTVIVEPSNVTGVIKTFVVSPAASLWQIEFNPPFDKTSQDTLTITFEIEWGRYDG